MTRLESRGGVYDDGAVMMGGVDCCREIGGLCATL